MYQFLSYLHFYFSATNQHGVHSPFVYNYVTKCLYKKTGLRVPVTLKILLKSITYFEYKTVRLLQETDATKQKIKTNCPAVTFVQNKSDVIFGTINAIQTNDLDPNQFQNNTMLFVDAIHKNRNNLEQWENLKAQNQVRVTIDLFYCGVAFFRKEQAKEDFKIRI